jgi:hypothetical protein
MKACWSDGTLYSKASRNMSLALGFQSGITTPQVLLLDGPVQGWLRSVERYITRCVFKSGTRRPSEGHFSQFIPSRRFRMIVRTNSALSGSCIQCESWLRFARKNSRKFLLLRGLKFAIEPGSCQSPKPVRGTSTDTHCFSSLLMP